MPLYEFACSTCGKSFERRMHFGADQKNIRCPEGHRTVKRIYSAATVLYKGSGFYVTDHRHGSPGETNK